MVIDSQISLGTQFLKGFEAMPQKETTPTVRYLAKLLKRLSKSERNVACLYYLESVSVGDIAMILHKDENHVEETLQRIKTHLGMKLQNQTSPPNLKL